MKMTKSALLFIAAFFVFPVCSALITAHLMHGWPQPNTVVKGDFLIKFKEKTFVCDTYHDKVTIHAPEQFSRQITSVPNGVISVEYSNDYTRTITVAGAFVAKDVAEQFIEDNF